jgi:hypothetical protein
MTESFDKIFIVKDKNKCKKILKKLEKEVDYVKLCNEVNMKKTCSKCGETKDFCEFNKKANGLRLECKSCQAEHRKKYYEKNKEKYIEIQEKYRKNNKEKIKETRKKYLENNGRKTLKKYYENNKQEIKKYQKKYECNNRVVIYNKVFNFNTAPQELKPVITGLIILRKKNKLLKEINNG